MLSKRTRGREDAKYSREPNLALRVCLPNGHGWVCAVVSCFRFHFPRKIKHIRQGLSRKILRISRSLNPVIYLYQMGSILIGSVDSYRDLGFTVTK